MFFFLFIFLWFYGSLWTDSINEWIQVTWIYLDLDVSMRAHVIRIISRCCGALRLLRSIRRSVSAGTFQELVVSLVLSRLDYENATLAGLPVYLLNQLQAVMNAGTRLIFNASIGLPPFLRQLHWLRVPDQITFKLATMMFQCINGTALGYLSSDVCHVADVPGRKHLRSAVSSLLISGVLLKIEVGIRWTRRRRRRGSSRQRRREGRGMGRGCPLPSRLGGLGSVVSSPSGVRKRFSVHFELEKHHLLASRPNCTYFGIAWHILCLCLTKRTDFIVTLHLLFIDVYYVYGLTAEFLLPMFLLIKHRG